jgi:hypothetical protein
MSRTLNDATRATDPGRIVLSHPRLKKLLPELYGLSGLYYRLKAYFERRPSALVFVEEHLLHGDSRAAVVISTDPLLIAAYTDELDCVALLEYSEELADELVDEYSLRPGKRLLTVNTYKREDTFDDDLDIGPRNLKRWTGFHPIIADFVSEDSRRIARRIQEIGEAEYQRARAMGQAYVNEHPGVARDGRPCYASLPAQ